MTRRKGKAHPLFFTYMYYIMCTGADPRIVNHEGETALDVARKGNHTKCIEVLEVSREREGGIDTATFLSFFPFYQGEKRSQLLKARSPVSLPRSVPVSPSSLTTPSSFAHTHMHTITGYYD